MSVSKHMIMLVILLSLLCNSVHNSSASTNAQSRDIALVEIRPPLFRVCCIEAGCFMVPKEVCDVCGGVYMPDVDNCDVVSCPEIDSNHKKNIPSDNLCSLPRSFRLAKGNRLIVQTVKADPVIYNEGDIVKIAVRNDTVFVNDTVIYSTHIHKSRAVPNIRKLRETELTIPWIAANLRNDTVEGWHEIEIMIDELCRYMQFNVQELYHMMETAGLTKQDIASKLVEYVENYGDLFREASLEKFHEEEHIYCYVVGRERVRYRFELKGREPPFEYKAREKPFRFSTHELACRYVSGLEQIKTRNKWLKTFKLTMYKGVSPNYAP